eukprot:symbB.v1.2.039935.t1/scaffold6886.1/size14820/2
MGNVCYSTAEDRFSDFFRVPPERYVQQVIRQRTNAEEALQTHAPTNSSNTCPRSARWHGEGPLPVIREEEVVVLNSASPSRCESKETQDAKEDELTEEEVPCPVLLGRGTEEKVPAFMPGPAWKSTGADATFMAALAAAKNLRQIRTEDQLRLYSLQKQATVGPVRGACPGLLELRARAKWRAWAKLCSMDREVAKKEYCALIDNLVPGWRRDAQLE